MTSAPSEHPDTSIAALGRDDLERLEVRDQARAAKAATVVFQLPRVRPRSSRRTRHSSVAAGPRSPVGYALEGISVANRAARTSRFLVSHSQTTITYQPSSWSWRHLRLSRLIFSSNLDSQNARLLFGR